MFAFSSHVDPQLRFGSLTQGDFNHEPNATQREFQDIPLTQCKCALLTVKRFPLFLVNGYNENPSTGSYFPVFSPTSSICPPTTAIQTETLTAAMAFDGQAIYGVPAHHAPGGHQFYANQNQYPNPGGGYITHGLPSSGPSLSCSVAQPPPPGHVPAIPTTGESESWAEAPNQGFEKFSSDLSRSCEPLDVRGVKTPDIDNPDQSHFSENEESIQLVFGSRAEVRRYCYSCIRHSLPTKESEKTFTNRLQEIPQSENEYNNYVIRLLKAMVETKEEPLPRPDGHRPGRPFKISKYPKVVVEMRARRLLVSLGPFPLPVISLKTPILD